MYSVILNKETGYFSDERGHDTYLKLDNIEEVYNKIENVTKQLKIPFSAISISDKFSPKHKNDQKKDVKEKNKKVNKEEEK